MKTEPKTPGSRTPHVPTSPVPRTPEGQLEDESADPVGPTPAVGGKSKPAPGAQSRTPKTKAA